MSVVAWVAAISLGTCMLSVVIAVIAMMYHLVWALVNAQKNIIKEGELWRGEVATIDRNGQLHSHKALFVVMSITPPKDTTAGECIRSFEIEEVDERDEY